MGKRSCRTYCRMCIHLTYPDALCTEKLHFLVFDVQAYNSDEEDFASACNHALYWKRKNISLRLGLRLLIPASNTDLVPSFALIYSTPQNQERNSTVLLSLYRHPRYLFISGTKVCEAHIQNAAVKYPKRNTYRLTTSIECRDMSMFTKTEKYSVI